MRKIVLGVAAVAAFASSPALAANATNTSPVSVNIINSCTVSATIMNAIGEGCEHSSSACCAGRGYRTV